MRVLYSFPHRIGSERICLTAWQQAVGVSQAGAEVTVLCGSVSRPLGKDIRIHTTLSRWGMKIPFRVTGRYLALQMHDWLTSRWLEENSRHVDLVHTWPVGSLRTIRTAKSYGIPCLLERPNAHTEYAYLAAEEENRRLGIELPAGHDHAFDKRILEHERAEYLECDYLLCPSDFVSRTFIERSIPGSKILHHHYGFDEERFISTDRRSADYGLSVLYAGVCEPRKGLHYALEAWLASDARHAGRFRICGNFVPGYAERLAPMLAHPSIEILGHRMDLPELMRESDVFILSSVEEGSALVTYEARGSGCVLLVSDASGALCNDGLDALVHPMRSVEVLTEHLNRVHHDRQLLSALREASLAGRDRLTWKAAGISLFNAYRMAIRPPLDTASGR